VRQSVLGPLGLRRASGGRLAEDGTVNVAFAQHERSTRCRSLSDAWLLHARLLHEQQPKAAGTLDELASELQGLLGTTDLAHELDHWRDDWLRRAFAVPNQVPMLAVVLAFLLLAHMTDDEHHEALALSQTAAAVRAHG
jgi:hypothetical protein